MTPEAAALTHLDRLGSYPRRAPGTLPQLGMHQSGAAWWPGTKVFLAGFPTRVSRQLSGLAGVGPSSRDLPRRAAPGSRGGRGGPIGGQLGLVPRFQDPAWHVSPGDIFLWAQSHVCNQAIYHGSSCREGSIRGRAGHTRALAPNFDPPQGRPPHDPAVAHRPSGPSVGQTLSRAPLQPPPPPRPAHATPHRSLQPRPSRSPRSAGAKASVTGHRYRRWRGIV